MRRTDAQQGFSSAAADADVIVVGCGLAGLSAALAAAQRRARVVLFDSSSDLFATNDVADRLYFNAVDPERQGDLGITDSPELFYRQTLAAGGFASDAALCARHDRRLGALFDMRGGRASGLGLRAAVKAGAYLVGTDYFSLTMGTAGRAGFAVCPFHPLRFILVDASGGRVVNEQDREAVVEALLDAPGNVLWLAASFSDVARLPEVRRGRIEALLAEGTARRVTGSEDMAGMEGAPSRASIVDAVRTYGEGPGDRLGKSWRVRIDDNDMLVMPVTLGRSATLGGVRIDGGGRVLTASGEHVEGLFAAGEITGGVHGMRCVPGNLSLESVVFGREAGFAAAGRSA